VRVAAFTATEIVPTPVPAAGVRVIQLADVLALQAALPAAAVTVICRLDEPPAASENVRLSGETVREGPE
jgi:energy-converting hydrogenase Eha subunit A